MRRKLLKYEFKVNARILLPLYAATLVCAVIFGFMVRGSEAVQKTVYDSAMTVFTLMFAAVWFMAVAMSFIYSTIHFQKNMLGPEGYLMHTLPVKTEAHLLTKLAAAVFYQCLGFGVSLISVLIITIELGGANVLSSLARTFETLLKNMDIQWVITAITAALIFLFAIAMFNAAVYASLAFGHSFNSGKMPLSVGMFALLVILGFNLLIRIYENLCFNGNLLPVVLAEALLSVIGMVMADLLMKKKLNLE